MYVIQLEAWLSSSIALGIAVGQWLLVQHAYVTSVSILYMAHGSLLVILWPGYVFLEQDSIVHVGA